MGEKRESSSTRGEQSADSWSLPEERLREILNCDKEERRLAYAEMLDRYHDIFDFLKELETMAASGRIEVDRMRDRLHKQLFKVGKTLGKDVAEVQVDLLRREGNLAEYGLPEYGILSDVDIFEGSVYDQGAFGGLTINFRKQGFSRIISEAKLLKDKKEWNMNQRNEAFDEDVGSYKEQSRRRAITVPPFGRVPVVETLRPHEVAILFGVSFTVDIDTESCPMIPADYPERLRRAVLAVQELEGTLFMRTIGAYHDTTTIFGVVVDAARLDSDVVGLLRGHRDRFGLRKEDMDLQVIEHDRKEEIERIKRKFASEDDRGNFFEQYLKKRVRFFGK